MRVGHLVPLLAVYVLLGQLTGWTIMYHARGGVPFNYVTLVVVTIVVGGYYLLSSLGWPEEAGEWPDFDAYYDQFNRAILSGNLALTIIGLVVSNLFAPPPDSRLLDSAALTWIALVGVMGALAINVVLIFVRGRRTNAALLMLLILLQVGGAVAGVRVGLADEHLPAPTGRQGGTPARPAVVPDQLSVAGRSASRSPGETAAVGSGRKS